MSAPGQGGLFFPPRAAATGSIQPSAATAGPSSSPSSSSATAASTSSQPPSGVTGANGRSSFLSRQPPPNFSRGGGDISSPSTSSPLVRQPKSPFITRPSTSSSSKGGGKQRNLNNCTIEELTTMLERNTQLLDSREITQSLPGGDAQLRSHQERILSRLKELRDVREIREDLRRTHIDPDTFRDEEVRSTMEGIVLQDGDEGDMKVKPEQEEDDVTSTPIKLKSPQQETKVQSPKLRILQKADLSSSQGLTASISLQESITRQTEAVRIQMQLAQTREERSLATRLKRRSMRTGLMLKDAMAVDSSKMSADLSSFMFYNDSDMDEDDDDHYDEDHDGDNVLALQGDPTHTETDEMAELNPLRQAYLEGYMRAEKEMAAT